MELDGWLRRVLGCTSMALGSYGTPYVAYQGGSTSPTNKATVQKFPAQFPVGQNQQGRELPPSIMSQTTHTV